MVLQYIHLILILSIFGGIIVILYNFGIKSKSEITKMKKISLILLVIALLISGCTQNSQTESTTNDETLAESIFESENDTESAEEIEETEPEKVNRTYTYSIQELMASRDDNQIYGVVYIPKEAGEKMPTVIFSHGLGGNYEAGKEYAKALAKKGYVVYCFDYCGGGNGSKSDGSTLDMSLFTEQADLEAVLNMIREQSFVDTDNIFLMGMSMGGAVSAITAADYKDEIQGMVLLYPAFVLSDAVKALVSSPDELPDKYELSWITVGRAFGEKLFDYDIYDVIPAYDKDVLIIHGDSDTTVPISYSEKALEVYSSASLEVIKGADHGFYGKDEQKAIELTIDYLESHKK